MWETAVRNSHRPGRRFAFNPFIRAVGERHPCDRRSKDRLSAFLARNRKGGRALNRSVWALNKRIVLRLIGWPCGRSFGTARTPRIARGCWALKTGRPGIHSSAFRLGQCFAYASARRKPREDKGVCSGRSGWCMRQTRSLAYDDQVMSSSVSDRARKHHYRFGSRHGRRVASDSARLCTPTCRALRACPRKAF